MLFSRCQPTLKQTSLLARVTLKYSISRETFKLFEISTKISEINVLPSFVMNLFKNFGDLPLVGDCGLGSNIM